MSSPPQFPPPKPISNHANCPLSHPNKPTSLPDLLLAAVSLFFFFSSATTTTTAATCKSFRISFSSFPSKTRRFLRIPSMSHPHRNPSGSHLNVHHFNTPQSLADWLKPRLPSDSFASWGVNPGTKNVHNLWLELSEGETSLADSTPPVRTVQVISVRIVDKHDRVLVESSQELSDGTVRYRNRPLSEKMKPNETPESAVFRAVREELGSIIHGSGGYIDSTETVRIVPGSYKKKIEERNSVSYPGLPACYILHSMDAWVEGLPEGEFWTEEEEYRDCYEMKVAEKAVSVKRHCWKWVSADSVES